MAFTEAQVKSLEAKLDAKHVKTRQVQETVLTYVEGWHLIAEANRIFGFDAWDRKTTATNCVWTGVANRQHSAAYTAKVRIAVRAGGSTIVREGCGSGEGRGLTPGEAHDLALKSAETDATKRALATFGNPFGLALYDRELSGVRNRKSLERSASQGPWSLRANDGKAEQSFEKADEFAVALRAALSEADTVELLFAIWERNVGTVRALNKCSPTGERAEALVAHFKQCAANLAKWASPSPSEQTTVSSTANGREHPTIDKSALTLSEPRRIRSKEHLRFVARQPCLICGRSPSHAHHVRYAQPRGLALKVSDEFTVPLCAIHHTEIHATGDERQWWLERNVDALKIASELWLQGPARSSGGDISSP
jgi:Rad52/22 family double-strand break repair protein